MAAGRRLRVETTERTQFVPWKADYRHAEGNSAAHVKTILTGSSVMLPLREGTIELGRWQEIFFCEFDGPRARTVLLTVVPAP
jgi:secondary thiamine-phosphate synthase enzyme